MKEIEQPITWKPFLANWADKLLYGKYYIPRQEVKSSVPEGNARERLLQEVLRNKKKPK